MKQEYDEDVKHQVEESEMRDREMQRKLLEQKEKEEEEKRRREEEIKKVRFLTQDQNICRYKDLCISMDGQLHKAMDHHQIFSGICFPV